MTDEELKKLTSGIVQPLTEKIDQLSHDVSGLRGQIKEIKQVQDQHTESLAKIETTIGSYRDSYLINNDNAKRLNKRLKRVERKLDIEIDPDLEIVETAT